MNGAGLFRTSATNADETFSCTFRSRIGHTKETSHHAAERTVRRSTSARGAASGNTTANMARKRWFTTQEAPPIAERSNMIKDSGERTEFETGAVRDMHIGKGRMDLLPWHAIIEVSKHCENGALKYGEHNVDKGIPMSSLIDSGLRHTAKFVIGMEDEPHLTAACWNLLWALEMKLTKPDMVDVPYKEDE